MSLFDVIKYPISDRPTAAELSALPDNVKEYLKSEIGVSFLSPQMAALSLRIMMRQDSNNARAKDIIQKLRTYLLELP